MDKLGKNVRRQSRRIKEKPFLPDEIISNILIRLPVKILVRFELVCRQWRAIILCPDFVDLHFRSNRPPLILVSPKSRDKFDYFGVDKWWDLSITRLNTQTFPFCADDFPAASLRNFSHAGLVVLEAYPWLELKIRILNPAMPRECVEISYAKEFWLRGSRICAVYYHPLLEEYCSLWEISKPGSHPETVQYLLLNLGSKPTFKRIVNQFVYRATYKNMPTLFINNHLYWMLKCEEEQDDGFGGRSDILEFDVITEEFDVLSCPVPLDIECKELQTRLLNIDGVISFVLILPSTITIWRLEDRVQQFWTSIEYTTGSLERYRDVTAFNIVSVVDEKLAFKSVGRLFVCDLVDGTVKNVSKAKWYRGAVLFLSHQMTLASLNKCKSPLYIDKDGKVISVV